MSEEKEKTLLLRLSIGVIVSAVGFVLYGGLAGWWTYTNGAAFIASLIVLGVIAYIWGAPGVRAVIVGVGMLFVASFIMGACGLLSSGAAELITAIDQFFHPTVVFVQNTGEYDNIKYGTGPFWMNLGGQFVLGVALILLRFATRGRAPFNILMVLINFVVGIILISFGGQHANLETAFAESIIFFGSIVIALYWEIIVEAAVEKLQDLPERARRYWLYVLGTALSQPLIVLISTATTAIFVAVSLTLVNMTAMTVSQALSLVVQGSIVATLFEGVLIEVESFGRRAQTEE